MPSFDRLNYNQKVNYVALYVRAIVAILGIIGNILVICVFFRRSLRKYSYAFYSQMKVCGDIVVLLYTFNQLASFDWDDDLTLVANWLCSISQYTVYVCYCQSLDIGVYLPRPINHNRVPKSM